MHMNPNNCFVGIDVSKATLEVGVLPQETFWSSPNNEAGREELVTRLREMAPTLIVLEATGGYEAVIAVQLAAAGLPVVVMIPTALALRGEGMNPRQVRDFAKACGKLAKTDRADCSGLRPSAKVGN